MLIHQISDTWNRLPVVVVSQEYLDLNILGTNTELHSDKKVKKTTKNNTYTHFFSAINFLKLDISNKVHHNKMGTFGLMGKHNQQTLSWLGKVSVTKENISCQVLH